MWVFTSFGLLMPAIRPPKYTPDWDDRRLQIRARRASDLDILRAKYMQGTLGSTIHTPDKDYEYRAYCTHEAWSVAMMKMSQEIDYAKFKPTTDRYRDHRYHSVLNSIWSVVLRELSTKKHQYEYWSSQGADDWRPSSYQDTVTSVGTAAGGSKKGGSSATSTGWPDDPPQHSYQPRAGQGPEDVRPRSPLLSGGAATVEGEPSEDWRDCRQPKPSGYAASPQTDGTWGGYLAAKYGPEPTKAISLAKPRNVSATRDDYEPEVWEMPAGDPTASLSAQDLSDEDWRALESLIDALPSSEPGARKDPLLEGLDVVTRAEIEVAELMASLGNRMTHEDCEHGWSPNAKSRCRRQHNNKLISRIEEIERLIEDVKIDRERHNQPALSAG